MGVEFLVETTIVAPDGKGILLLIIIEELFELVPLPLGTSALELMLSRLFVIVGTVEWKLEIALLVTPALEESGFTMLVADWLTIVLALTLFVVGIIEDEP